MSIVASQGATAAKQKFQPRKKRKARKRLEIIGIEVKSFE
jgi:hypothetical protein